MKSLFKGRYWLNLRLLIVALAGFSTLGIFFSSLYSSNDVHRQLLLENAQEANLVYAKKLSNSVEVFLDAVGSQAEYIANRLGEQEGSPVFWQSQTDSLLLGQDSFNAAVLVDAQGRVRAASPQGNLELGRVLVSQGALAALSARQPRVSKPYLTTRGHYSVLLSHPVFNERGQFDGYLGGVIYLREANVLSDQLGAHYYRDGSYVYVLDSEGRLLYHPDVNRIGERVKPEFFDALVESEPEGILRYVNSENKDMVAGYASIPSTGWVIVSQRPVERVLESQWGLTQTLIWKQMPSVLISFFLIWLISILIAHPLRSLALLARDMNEPGVETKIKRVKAWYFETSLIKKAMLTGIELLQQRIGALDKDAHTDPLTGLYNRRGMEKAVSEWTAKGVPFSVIALDIDYFKQVNDTFGHDVGDAVLICLAQLMWETSRNDDICCRLGGEEFLIIVAGPSLDIAIKVAERLRALVEKTNFSEVHRITISLGLAHSGYSHATLADVMQRADEQLYAAKASGRNCMKVERLQ